MQETLSAPSFALTIAGSDPTGGAGIQSDLRSFAVHGVFGGAVVTAITVQTSSEVLAVEAVPASLVEAQLEAVLRDARLSAAKTGMLGSAAAVERIARLLRLRAPGLPLVVDPVIRASSGHSLLEAAGLELLCAQLLPLASVVTPNLDEAALLLGQDVLPAADAAAAAVELARRFNCAVVVKGGHGKGAEVVDQVAMLGPGEGELQSFELLASRRDTQANHGTGCLFSASLCAALALGQDLASALHHARSCMNRGLDSARSSLERGGSVWLDQLPDTRDRH
ncbi:MAG: bifunctional hydroxymethylpyrimidine kinase/phosphomethylpyrimidine kinase [Rickettsiales bacterium]|nr:bifunctional hydroxymethylpyrimidine kinase/phosphomethylpyrimidine kinase [Rickettsiales bacterium]